MKNVSVLPIGPFSSAYTYETSEELNPGDVVSIPLGRRSTVGVVSLHTIITDKSLKSVIHKYNYQLPDISIDFINWVSSYSMYPAGKVLKMVLCEPTLFTVKKETIIQPIKFNMTDINLSHEQLVAFDKICELSEKCKPILLHGITGSGKTEVYLKYLQNVIKNEKQVLILFPEIALTQQMIDRIHKYFGVTPLVWNSNVNAKERRNIWVTVNSGYPCIVIGSRSSLFLPFKNMSAIVVDEEHDTSYKQSEGVLYNARDMAIVRAKLGNIPIILSSATPSLETYINAHDGKYGYVELQSRFGSSVLPKIEIVDLRKNKSLDLISEKLRNELNVSLLKGEQVLLYLNRRGYAPVTLCKSCGIKIDCPNCSALLVNYKSRNTLLCHYCGHTCSKLNQCYSCESEDKFITYGAGVEKLYEEVKLKFPNENILIASSDTMNSDSKIEQIVNDIKQHKASIIIATQILAKGHHFSNLTTIGIIDGDFGLDRADIRAHERTYQLLHQVIGRAGRESKQGSVYIQTYEPMNNLFDILKRNNTQRFFENEMSERKEYSLPPYCRMVAIIISGNNSKLVEETAKNLARAKIENAILLGPAPAPIVKIRGKTRWRILIKSPKNAKIQKDVSDWMKNIKIHSGVSIQIDVDPINFM